MRVFPDEADRKRVVGCLAGVLASAYAYESAPHLLPREDEGETGGGTGGEAGGAGGDGAGGDDEAVPPHLWHHAQQRDLLGPHRTPADLRAPPPPPRPPGVPAALVPERLLPRPERNRQALQEAGPAPSAQGRASKNVKQ